MLVSEHCCRQECSSGTWCVLPHGRPVLGGLCHPCEGGQGARARGAVAGVRHQRHPHQRGARPPHVAPHRHAVRGLLRQVEQRAQPEGPGLRAPGERGPEEGGPGSAGRAPDRHPVRGRRRQLLQRGQGEGPRLARRGVLVQRPLDEGGPQGVVVPHGQAVRRRRGEVPERGHGKLLGQVACGVRGVQQALPPAPVLPHRGRIRLLLGEAPGGRQGGRAHLVLVAGGQGRGTEEGGPRRVVPPHQEP
mmetsp:Transcript_56544/g.165358  ORF Transcript_56544/g.165358 Transcript_56544/m.165358 type:complete len:247 (-) Transcript_56544:769-1509(-)